MLKKATLLAVLLLVVIVSPVLADNGETIPTFDEALIYASSMAGIAVIIGFVISLLLDYWPAYADLTTAQKRALYAVLCLVLPVGAATLRGTMGYTPWTFDPLYWHALWCGVAAWIAGTLMHLKVRKATG